MQQVDFIESSYPFLEKRFLLRDPQDGVLRSRVNKTHFVADFRKRPLAWAGKKLVLNLNFVEVLAH